MKRCALCLPLLAILAACGQSPGSSPAHSGLAEAARSRAATVQAPATPGEPSTAPGFDDLLRRLSEPDGPFFSDNTISNETSYLQVAGALGKRRAQGGAYIGVGPEQNFTYIAMTRPEVAFIVDIRRQNLVEHLLYRAAFQEAKSRSHFVTLLLGRPYDAETAPPSGAPVNEVLAHAEVKPKDLDTFAAVHNLLRERIERDVRLDAADRKTLEITHRAFFKNQLDVRFSLKEANGRVYPTFRELLLQRDPQGVPRGFLGSEESFRFVQRMEREGRVVPVVGDFAGDRAMPQIAAYLKEHKIRVSAFYVSNVEQYLFEPKVWPKWARNVASLPIDEDSVFIRAYLDQGKPHPLQMKGHRTATVLQSIALFNEHQAAKPYRSFWSLVTDGRSGESG